MKSLATLLERDAFMPREDIAKILNISVEEVNRRISQLEANGVILGYHALINRDLAERDIVTAIIEVKIMPERDGGFDRIAERISNFEEVRGCYLMSGGYDLLVTVEAPNLRGIAAFVSDKLSAVGAVQASATHFRLKTYKENGIFHNPTVETERLSVSP